MPVTKYTRSGDVNIAYQLVGDGPRDIVYVPGWVSNVEVMWDLPGLARFLQRLASFSRLILFDKRGTGMSDPVPGHQLPTLETRMDDVRAVMDAAGSKHATLIGHSEGGNLCVLFAATYPTRTDGLILLSSWAKRVPSESYPWAPPTENREAEIAETERTWGDPEALPEWMAPSRAGDQTFREQTARYFRLSASPKAAADLLRMNTQIDVTAVLPTVGVPTLCLYCTDDADVSVEEGRWIAGQIPGAKLVERPGEDHLFWADESATIADDIEEFVTGYRASLKPERVLVTVLFTDIVGSTARASELGDGAWRRLLEQHNAVVRAEVARQRGREIGTQGDGFLATFDGPARAIDAAQAIGRALGPLGIAVRAGVHTGEVEIIGDDVAGLAVHIGARICALAEAGEVLVSRTVRDLVAGSGIDFASRGIHGLKGVPEDWELYAALPGPSLEPDGELPYPR